MAPYVRYANQGATRNQPLDQSLVDAFSFLPELGLAMEVFSGGQPAKGTSDKRVGSVRHDHGKSADVFFTKGGQRLNWARDSDRPIFEDIVKRAAAAGVTGFGAGPGYMREGSMHVGFGSPSVWGAGGKGANAPDWLRRAFSGAASAPAAAGAPATASRMLSPQPMAQTPEATTAPALFGDLVAANQVQTVPVPQPQDFATYLAQRKAAEAEAQAADQQRKLALFGDDLFGVFG
ncbi:MAG: hypothetical protein Unbinned2301contig1004_5 [Prokaryotic dsDNA virus sp.]|nr:MAG: hypothetical protein Unbinned2301contig1004_5 [Prokaryotic dsDNA virus sp.]|tara:strand:- start:15633 stop:16334 length:702 start_codon:yes stop_codon:yes gene_type:complete